MLRIEIEPNEQSRLRVTLQGTLTGRWVDELQRLLAGRPDASLELDLSEVRFMDPAGEALLRERLNRGAQLTRCSPYVAALLALEPLP